MVINGNFNSIIIRTEGLSEQEKELVTSVYKENGKDAMYEYFKTKKILPFAAKTFSNLGIDVDYWEPILESYRERNKKVITFLDVAYSSMKQHGVKKVFLSENFGALLSADGDIGLFASGDTDNCYAPEEKDKIYTALNEIGCTCKEVYSQKRLNGSCWYPNSDFGLPEKFYLGLKPTPLSRLYLPSFVGLEDFEVWENMQTYKDTNIQIPNPSALMYICMPHISLHSFSRSPDIRLYTDLLNMSKTNVDYDKIVSWAKRNNTKVRISVASTIANKLMKTNIPEELLNLSDRKFAVLKIVFDSEKQDLKYEPYGLDVLKIEAGCDDKSTLHGILEIAFPNHSWMKETYGSDGIGAYCKHIRRIL